MVSKDNLIVVTTNNGGAFLPSMLKTLPKDVLVVDTGSTDEEYKKYLKTLNNVDYIDGGYTIGTMKHTIENHNAKRYLFLHDSMLAKTDLKEFEKADVVGWLSFPMFFDNPSQQEYVETVYGKDHPDKGIFGPIFSATKEAMDKVKLDVPTNPDHFHGAERGLATAFSMAGIKVEFIDEYDTERIDRDDYKDLIKFRPKRP